MSGPATTNVSDALLLAQFAASSDSPQQPPQIHDEFYATMLSLLQSQSPHSSLPFLPPGSSSNLYGNVAHPNQMQHNLQPTSWTQSHNLGPRSLFPVGSNTHPYHHSMGSMPQYGTSAHSAPASVSASSPIAEAMDAAADEANITEDKRRRNTVASARFRIKKKQRHMNLERTVSDLTGRAEELEREVADLRRENGWLKEIVMLKGSRLAGLDVSPHTLRAQNEASGSRSTISAVEQAGGSPLQQQSDSEQSDSEADSDYQPDTNRGGKKTDKGKAKR
ncbi:hypothetical protein D9758_000482 [Tetrapyrgos nigripes]|uniref:BZIP domain-containing protein n=1 Tax=Tetrapyrgos nigripes TaxID=182062 RepID=A0A8H5LZ57_9AGAR|nr:hypothetical protein D9758_000482 [Tetrapyrgos nigripes]